MRFTYLKPHPVFKVLTWSLFFFPFVACCGQVDNSCANRIDYTTNDINEGIDLDALFEAPTVEELAEVREKWSNFDMTSDAVQLIDEYKAAASTRRREVKVIMHEAENRKHYGGIILPLNYDSTQTYPLMIWAEGLSQDNPLVNLEEGYGIGFSKLIPEHFVLVPSYRGQSLLTDNGIYCSDGFFGDAFDGATDDALRFLQVVLDLYSTSIDQRRLSIYGGSRGGTVALLAGIRYPTLSKVVSQSGPVQFHNRECYDRFSYQFKYQFLNKKQSIHVIRQKLIECSPLYFIEQYQNDLFVVHGRKDSIVPIWNAQSIVDSRTKGDRLEFLFTNDGHGVRAAEKIATWIKAN